MPVLLNNIDGNRRAHTITQDEADRMVRDGEAVQDRVHARIYEEITDGERTQGYMTRSMVALDHVVKKKPGRPPKIRTEEAPADPVED
jgi:hypothetical protein